MEEQEVNGGRKLDPTYACNEAQVRLTSRPKNDQRSSWILWSWEQCFQERSIATDMNALKRTYLDLSARVTIQRHCKPRIGNIQSNIVHRKPCIFFTPHWKGIIYADRQFQGSHTLTACVQKKTQENARSSHKGSGDRSHHTVLLAAEDKSPDH